MTGLAASVVMTMIALRNAIQKVLIGGIAAATALELLRLTAQGTSEK